MIPISFSIPECKILKKIPEKKKLLAHIIPGRLNTYIFSDESDYYLDYQDSVFGITCKKAGWDCLRHYEILANGCIPLFLDLHLEIPSSSHFAKSSVFDNLINSISSIVQDILLISVILFKSIFLLSNKKLICIF